MSKILIAAGALLSLGLFAIPASADGPWQGFNTSPFAGLAAFELIEDPVRWSPMGPLPPLELGGGVGGTRAGIDLQVGPYVFGIQVIGAKTNAGGVQNIEWCHGCYYNQFDTYSVTMNFMAAALGRVGFTPTPNVLVYGVAGFGAALLTTNFSQRYFEDGLFYYGYEEERLEFGFGGVVGGGVELQLGNATLGVEYLSTRMNIDTLSWQSTTGSGSAERLLRGHALLLSIGFTF